jgi:outer membrane protein
MNKKIPFLLLISTSIYANSTTLSIDKLIEIALKNSPDVQIGRLNFDASKARERFQVGYYYPHIDISAQADKGYSKFKTNSSRSIELLSGEITLYQLLYDFGKQSSSVEASLEESLSYKAQMYQIVSNKILEVKETYYEILKAYEIKEAYRKNLTLQKNQLYRAKKYLKAGIRTIIDVSDAKIRLEEAKRDLANAQYNIELLYAKMENILGKKISLNDKKLYRVKLKNISLLKQIPIVKESLSRLKKYAYKHRYILKSIKHSIKQSKSILSATKKSYYPTISLRADYTNRHLDRDVINTLAQRESHISLDVSMNVFDGFQKASKVEEAKLKMLMIKSQKESIKLAINQEVLNSYLSVRRAKDNIALNETILKRAKEKLSQAKKRYENGLSDFIELQISQQDYINSLIALKSSYYDYFIEIARLNYSIGR